MNQAQTHMTGVKRILIVDDHFLVREGLAKLIARHKDLEVCGQASSADEALLLVEREKPDLAIVDIGLVDRDGLELMKELHDRFPGVLVLVLSMYEEKLYAEHAIRCGARGYLSKQEGPDVVVAAIRRVLGGEIYLSPACHAALLHRIFRNGTAPAKGSVEERLSSRELEVFTLTAKGLNNSDIAKRLRVTGRTVEGDRRRIKEKLGIESASQFVQAAVVWAKERAII